VPDAAALAYCARRVEKGRDRVWEPVKKICTARSVEEFWIEPSELTALMEVINAEMGRRIQTVGEAIHAARKVLH
jgi:hypothetical protein